MPKYAIIITTRAYHIHSKVNITHWQLQKKILPNKNLSISLTVLIKKIVVFILLSSKQLVKFTTVHDLAKTESALKKQESFMLTG
jgi:hypothetical protein